MSSHEIHSSLFMSIIFHCFTLPSLLLTSNFALKEELGLVCSDWYPGMFNPVRCCSHPSRNPLLPDDSDYGSFRLSVSRNQRVGTSCSRLSQVLRAQSVVLAAPASRFLRVGLKGELALPVIMVTSLAVWLSIADHQLSTP